MIITIDTDFISKVGLTLSEYIFLYLLYNDNSSSIEVNSSTVSSLEKKGFIKEGTEKIILRKKAIDLFNTSAIPDKKSDFEEFVEKYRSLFPAGVKSGGRLVKGDRLGCINKLKSFKNKYPEYTQDDVLEATKVYIDICRRKNYDRMTCADYFIEKDKLSQLASYCEDIKIRGNKVTESTNTSIGKTRGI